MKTVVRVKLRVTPEQSPALSRTLALCNAGVNLASQVAFEAQVFDKAWMQDQVYANLKGMGLSAQPTMRSLRKVVDSYKTLRSNARNGRLGKRGSKRWDKAMGKPIVFRPDSAQPFDDRCLSWQHDAQTVSIWTVDGRLKGIPFVGEPAQVQKLREFRQGESDLVEHQGNFYLVATLDLPDVATFEPRGFIGVDMSIENIAYTSTGMRAAGRRLNKRRRWEQNFTKRLQEKGTKSARRRLRARSGKLSRYAADVNHRISKTIVTEAVRTGRGIAVEDLTGIRDRVRLRKPQRVTLHSWAFSQLGQFLAYKAEAAGVPFVQVNPAYTSQACSTCGHVEKRNRPAQDVFACWSCGVTLHADHNASLNIADLGVEAWGAVIRPMAA